jgi:hypothetical protein
MLIRTLETSAAIWTSALITEYCNKNDVQDPETPFKAFTPPQDEAANSRILQYQQAVADCEKEARGVKRALRGYAPVYDRHHEFRGSDEDTATWVDGRYILYGEYSATRPKCQRRAHQPSECGSPTVLDIYDEVFWEFRHSLTLHLHHFFSQLNMSMASSVPSGESSYAIATQFIR